MSEGSDRRSLALGALVLSSLGFLVASGSLAVYAASESPLILVFPFLSAPLSLGGGILGLVLLRRGSARGPGRRIAWGAALVSASTLFGILPATVGVGLPGFRTHQLASREQQAFHFLSRLRMGAVSYRHEQGSKRFLEADSGWTPTPLPSSVRYPYDPAIWAREPWVSLDFAPTAAHFHQYRYRGLPDGSGFVVAARGDLDGDGEMVTYTSTVHYAPDGGLRQDGPDRQPPHAR